MDADTRDLLRESIRALLASRPEDLVAGLDELGWQDVISEDRAGAVELLFTEQGAAGRASAALDAVLIDAGGGDLRDATSARQPLVVVHPFGGVRSHTRGGQLLVDGVALVDPAESGGLVVAGDREAASVYLLSADHVATGATPVRGFDPASSLHRIHLKVALAQVTEPKSDWAAATAAAQRALASELVGNGTAMLDLAVDQVGQRLQFDRPIGANQTPRHRLAQSYALLTAARELAEVAWHSDTGWDATVAKTYAGFASDAASATCLQVCGAIGLTAEHSLGGYVKRARILDALYGGWRRSVHDIGVGLMRSGTIPAGPRV